jgi:penicillin-binding protein 1A
MAVVAGSLAGITLVYSVNLPQIHDLERYRPSTTTELYDRKGRVIGSFALEHRVVVNYDDFAPVLRQAVVSIEDKTFWSNGGINLFRIGGALIHDLRTHGREQGASTLTMQLAKNLFLSSDRTVWVKIQEAYLAIQIERSFTKQQIFTLYGNQIYLGSGQYGFEAASEYYFSKPAKDLTLTEAALLAGLPKGPSEFSPILHPQKSLIRRNLVLSEMESDGVIPHAQAEEARQAPLGLKIAQPQSVIAPWFQEEVRTTLEKHFDNNEVQQSGLRVYTTLDLDLQKTANQAVLDGLAAYERRHGWKGKLVNVLAQGETLADYKHPDWATQPHVGDYVHALVMRIKSQQIFARVGSNEVVIQPADWLWTEARKASELVKPGDIIYVHLTSQSGKDMHATLEQDSGTQGSLMAMDNTSGDVLAMVGGRDYDLSEYNRATQSERQVGSSFKPYVYSTAIEDGARPDDIILDTPVSFGGWSPHDYENNFKGAMTLTAALADSRNVPAVRLAARVGIHNVIAMAHRFGVTSNIPAYLPVALGAAGITLQEQVASYSVFPNDGVRVSPRYIRRVTDPDGLTLWEDPPAIKQVISQHTARTMVQMLQAVTSYGTAAEASQLHHPIGGKTGTTSNYTDAWFLGFTPSVTCGVWVGYDSSQSLGDKETGARAALPIWMTVMKQAIVGHEEEKFPADEPRQIPYQPQWTTAITAPPSTQTAPRPAAPTQTAQNFAPRIMPANATSAPAPRPFQPGPSASSPSALHPPKTTAKRIPPAFLRRKAPPVVNATTSDKLDSMIN